MNPFYFGTGRRRLFGLYTPGKRGGASTRAILLCHPWGQEYLRAHRSMRVLSSMLTGAGLHVLRFDYFGAGDSAGDETEGDLGGWEGDVEMAMEELTETTGAKRIGLVGLRLGATLAARVAARRPRQVDRLVLWDPVVSGPEYLQELCETARALSLVPASLLAERPAEQGGGKEILGFPLTAALWRELEGVDLLAQVETLPARSLAIVSHPVPSHQALRAALAARASDPVAFEEMESQPAWLEDQDSGAGAVPVKVLQRIVQWLA